MRRRAASPAASEPELDILDSLYPGEDENGHQAHSAGNEADFDDILDHAQGGDDDDEAFIALKQAASYRKNSNLKGKTVKKGGGFQAMGTPTSRAFTADCRPTSISNAIAGKN